MSAAGGCVPGRPGGRVRRCRPVGLHGRSAVRRSETRVAADREDLDLDRPGRTCWWWRTVDTGLTLTYLLRVLAARAPASLRVCALLDKRARRIVDVPLSYVGFEVPDVFLVGYGLDLDERERGRGELLAVDDLEAVRDNPLLLDLPTRPNDAWRPPRA